MSKKYIKNIAIISIILLFISGALVYNFNKNYLYNNTIAKNIFIQGIDVSNKTKEEAKKLVLEEYEPKDIILKYNDQGYKIKPQDIDLKYDLDKIVKEAFNYTRSNSYFENVKRYISLMSNKMDLTITSSYNETKLSEAINKIEEDINVKVVDAKVSISNSGVISYSPSTTGKELDLVNTKESIYNMINSKKFGEIDLKVDTKNPNLTTEQARGVNTLLGEFKTTFSTNNTNRVENIKISSQRINNILLMPGEEFSYNNLTGRRTKANGYKDAPVIMNGELTDDVGGGVCQVSTTIFNTAMYSGMNITTRANHSLKSSYVPVGQDAMVNDGWSDFKFKNPYNHPVYVKTVVDNGSVTCRIYGNNSDKKNISIKVDRFKENGKDAAKTYAEYRDGNGNIIETKYISKSVYKN